MLSLAAFALLPLTGLCAQSKFALLIGNGAYTGVTPLNNPVNDANDMKTALEGLGFEVDLITNATLQQMDDGVDRFRRNLASDNGAYGFFFYAGHGVQSRGNNYLIPVNAGIASESNLQDKAMAVQRVLDTIEAAGNALNVVVLDACRDNPFSWARNNLRGFTVIRATPPASIMVFAAGAGKTAACGDGRNSLFTAYLLKNLTNRNNPTLEVKDLFARVRHDVLLASNYTQHPEIFSKIFRTAYLGSRPQDVPQQIPVAGISTSVPVQPAPVAGTSKPAPVQSAALVEKSKPAPVQSVPVAETPASPPFAAPPQRPDSGGFLRIQGGTFMMGSPASEAGRGDRETPHRVTVSGFSMAQYEVTQREYEALMGNNPSRFRGANLPAERVSWFDAVAYCNALSQREGLTPAYTIAGENVTWHRRANGYRLPTEAEWEYACRAGTTGAFNTGDTISTGQVNYNDNTKETYRQQTTDVGNFASNPWGLYDMHGNVEEWCWDWDGEYSTADQTDPAGAASGSSRVLRGGGWYRLAQHVRSAYRSYNTPGDRNSSYGFRVVRP
jgi:formylglycine-generating enzyme required for sulfatase activity